jgi:cytochrome c-type biogenesis protein CcmH
MKPSFAGAALTVAVVILVAMPLLRAGAGTQPPARRAALAVAALLVLGAALLYVTWSNWKWHAAPEADSPQTMVARLARQLEQHPENLDGWLMLGRSYLVLQEYPLALRAFERADRMSEGKNVEALMGQAEALALTDESELAARAGKLIERALVLAPDSGKALFFGGAAAARRGDRAGQGAAGEAAGDEPPPSVQPTSTADQCLTRSGRSCPPDPQHAPGPRGPAPANTMQVNTRWPPLAAARGTLFVFVRHAGEGGPPLAARRLAGHFPQSVTLTPADAMIPGRTFSAGQEVQVVARIARSGSPVGVKGDPFGQIAYRVGQDGVLNLVIDQLTP